MERSGGLVGILNNSLSSRRNSETSTTSVTSVLWPFETANESTAVRFRHQRQGSHKLWCLRLLDFLVAFTLLPAAVTITWRGVWQFLDTTLTTLPSGANIDDHPQQKWRSIWTSLPVCLVFSFFLNAFQFHCSALLKNWFGNGGSKIKSIILYLVLKGTIFVSLVLGVACWRGFWDLWDLMLYKVTLMKSAQPEFQLAIILFVLINSFILVCWPMQVSRSLLSSPLQVSQDGGIEDIFESPTLFNKKPPNFDQQGYFSNNSHAWNWYFFDIFASTFLVQFLAVTCWWGLWTLEDKLLGPATNALVFSWYLVIGYSCAFVAYLLQFTVTKEIPTLPQKFWSELVVSIGFVGVVSLWKGIWDYSDVILSPLLGIEDRASNLAVQILLAYLVLFMFNNTSLASNRGVVLSCPETHEDRNQDLFVLDNLVLCFNRTRDQFASNLSFIDETSPLLE